MNAFVNKLNTSLDEKLRTIELEEPETLNKAKKSIPHITNALTQLKAFVLEYSFGNDDEEIHFFKKVKPTLFSKLLYFVEITNIESRRPIGNHEIQETYLKRELEKINSFFNNNLQFYQYYRLNSTIFDDKCFLRVNENALVFQDGLMFYADTNFSTSHDNLVAKIMANDRLEEFLNAEIEKLSRNSMNSILGKGGGLEQTLQWTDSKTSLIELVYALNAAGVFNNGQSEIREIAVFFEKAFNMQLTDVYQTFSEIKQRANPTKFIDTLKTSLIRKMEDD